MAAAKVIKRFAVCGFWVNSSFGGHLPLRSAGKIECMLPASNEISIQVKHKHWNPKFRRERAKKFLKVELPDFDEIRRDETLTVEEMRSKLKEKGIAPPRNWTEKPIFVSCTGSIFEPYIPPEGDGKISLVTQAGARQKMQVIEKKGATYMALRKIRSFEYDFDVPAFADKAQEIYIEAHSALTTMDEDKLHELVTEKCYPEMVDNVKYKTIRWKFMQSLELPRVVHIRCTDMITKDNIFAQATVRFHTQQILAVYDRFGRLMHGSEEMVKDVLEYVVFEKHLSHLYGSWRIHGKIIPEWMPPKEPIIKTYRKPNIIDEPTITKKENVETIDKVEEKESESSGQQPALA